MVVINDLDSLMGGFKDLQNMLVDFQKLRDSDASEHSLKEHADLVLNTVNKIGDIEQGNGLTTTIIREVESYISKSPHITPTESQDSMLGLLKLIQDKIEKIENLMSCY